jgi:hypothetical protein
MSKETQIAAGINYIRLMKSGLNVYDVAEEVGEDVDTVKRCITLARKHKDEADTNIKCTLIQPEIIVRDEYHTGMLQVVKGIELELTKPIIAKYATEKETEFQTLMPVKIKIKRK